MHKSQENKVNAILYLIQYHHQIFSSMPSTDRPPTDSNLSRHQIRPHSKQSFPPVQFPCWPRPGEIGSLKWSHDSWGRNPNKFRNRLLIQQGEYWDKSLSWAPHPEELFRSDPKSVQVLLKTFHQISQLDSFTLSQFRFQFARETHWNGGRFPSRGRKCVRSSVSLTYCKLKVASLCLYKWRIILSHRKKRSPFCWCSPCLELASSQTHQRLDPLRKSERNLAANTPQPSAHLRRHIYSEEIPTRNCSSQPHPNQGDIPYRKGGRPPGKNHKNSTNSIRFSYYPNMYIRTPRMGSGGFWGQILAWYVSSRSSTSWRKLTL